MKELSAFLTLMALLSVRKGVNAFTCTDIGRFENNYDPKCQTYYLCSETVEGITESLYKCPNDELFDPNSKTCSDVYTCSKPAFTCRGSGYYADLSDTACTRYFNCFNFFGFYFNFAQHCSAGKQFDPSTRSCSSSYDCGSYSFVSEEAVATTIPTTTEIILEVSKVNESSLSAVYALTSSLPEFTCTSMGLFADPNDPNCSVYYYCLPRTGGTFTKRKYKCPKFFDPTTKKCTEDYSCPTLSTTTISAITTTHIETTVSQELEQSDENIVVPVVGDTKPLVVSDLQVVVEGTTTPDVLSSDTSNVSTGSQSIFKPVDGITTTTVIHDTSSESTPIDDLTTEILDIISPEFKCTATGRYPDSLDISCTQYFLCSKLKNGTFLRTPYTCPSSSFFDPSLKRCSKTYICTETTTQYITTTTVVFTTEEAMTTILENDITTESPITTESAEFICSSTGRYPDLNDFTCKKYFLCSKLINGTFFKTPYTCPVSNFDPVNRVCSKSYVCPYIETTTHNPETTTTSLESTTEGIWDFSCYKVGRFRNMNDGNCKSYFLCNQLRNGTFIQTEYNCPSTAVFDRGIHICSTQISCM